MLPSATLCQRFAGGRAVLRLLDFSSRFVAPQASVFLLAMAMVPEAAAATANGRASSATTVAADFTIY